MAVMTIPQNKIRYMGTIAASSNTMSSLSEGFPVVEEATREWVPDGRGPLLSFLSTLPHATLQRNVHFLDTTQFA